MGTPAVSVIIVTFNHEPFIEEALESVLRQRLSVPLEILISEDASTDRTREVVQRFAALHRNVRLLLSERNLNSNEVTLRAIRAASGGLLAIMDGDDYWTAEDKLEKQVRLLGQQPDCSVCFHDVAVVDEHRNIVEAAHLRDRIAALTTIDDLLRGCYVPGSSPVIRRRAILSPPAWVETAPYPDWAILLAAARHGKLAFIPEALSAYRRHQGGVWSGLNDIQQASGLISCYDYLEPRIWPDKQATLRTARIDWRLKLLDLLEQRRDLAAHAAALDAGVTAGDFVSPSRAGEATPREFVLEVVAGAAEGFADVVQFGHIDEIRQSFDGLGLFARGWGSLPTQSPASLVVESSQPILRAVALRMDRPDVADAVDRRLDRSGFRLWLEFASPVSAAVDLFAMNGSERLFIARLASPQ